MSVPFSVKNDLTPLILHLFHENRKTALTPRGRSVIVRKGANSATPALANTIIELALFPVDLGEEAIEIAKVRHIATPPPGIGPYRLVGSPPMNWQQGD